MLAAGPADTTRPYNQTTVNAMHFIPWKDGSPSQRNGHHRRVRSSGAAANHEPP